MTIREATALVALYRACLGRPELRSAVRHAAALVPELEELARPEWPFRAHRTMEEVMRDEQD